MDSTSKKVKFWLWTTGLLFWLWTTGLFVLYCLWVAAIIFNPPGAAEYVTLADRAPAWCEFHNMKYYDLGSGSLQDQPTTYRCIDKTGEIHLFKEAHQ